MPSKMILLFGVPMFVGCCTILWLYWDRFKKPPKKKIFISADCWLSVFDLLTPSQLGHGIAMISHRFDIYVDEHFKTRKRTLALIRIRSKIGENGTKEMEIVNFEDRKAMPIPQKPLPKKIIRFKRINIIFIDRNVITFLRHFRKLLVTCPINLAIDTTCDRFAEFLLRNIWPMIATNIHGLQLSVTVFHRLRQFAPSILNDLPLLCIGKFLAHDDDADDLFAEFPCDDSAAASDGQAVAKWLFTPLQNDVPKVLKCSLDMDHGSFVPRIEAFKAAFASASSPVNFIVVIWFLHSSFADPIVPFNQTNELTREHLALKITHDDDKYYLLVRCPIARDENKWTKWEKEAIGWKLFDQWNRIDIQINEDKIGDGLFDATPGPIDQQQK